MKTGRISIFSSLMALFSVLLLLLGLVQELPLVLCIAPNGQVELEAETARGLCADWQSDRKPVAALKGVFRHCVDVPLSHLAQGKVIAKAAALMDSARLGGWLLHQVIDFSQPLETWVISLQNQNQWANPPPFSGFGAMGFLKTVILLL